jgi:hypothetical protein
MWEVLLMLELLPKIRFSDELPVVLRADKSSI